MIDVFTRYDVWHSVRVFGRFIRGGWNPFCAAHIAWITLWHVPD